MDRILKAFVSLAVLTMINAAGCAYIPKPAPVGDSPPVIDAWYASPTVRWGEQWRMYVKAHDPDGDLWEVRVDLDQPGVMYWRFAGHQILPQKYWSEINGYLYLHIPAQPFGIGKQDMNVHLTLADRGGRTTKEIVLPLRIGRTVQKIEIPDGVKDEPIMDIHIPIRSPEMGERDSLYFVRRPYGP
jgi:hypothetical protein